nr:hypothetical protein [Tanacetum cinerariifolium]
MHRTENQDEGHKKESQKWNDWIKEILEDAEMVKQREETEFLGTLEGASSGVCPMHFSVYVHKGPYAMVSPTNLYSVIEDAEKRRSMVWQEQTVHAVDLDEINGLCFMLDTPKSQT